MPTIEVLVFDFDGLILDTETPEVVAWTRVFDAHGAVFPIAWWHEIVGRGADQVSMTPIDHLETQIGSSVDREAIVRAQKAEHLKLVAEQAPRPGVVETLERARDLGMPCGVASSSHHAWVDSLLDRHGLLGSFSAILCRDDVPRAKPFPDLYLASCVALGSDPTNTLALEDSANGIAAAKAAGLWCVAVPNGVTVHMDLSAADLSVASLADQTLDEVIASLSKR